MAAPVYDEEKEKQAEGLGDEHLRRLTGISPDEEGAMEHDVDSMNHEGWNWVSAVLAHGGPEEDYYGLDLDKDGVACELLP